MLERTAFYGDVDEPPPTADMKALTTFKILEKAFRAESDTFLFLIEENGSTKHREVCEHGYLAILGLLTPSNEKPSMWNKMKATIRQGLMDQSEFNLKRERIALKSDDAGAFITNYAETACEAIPTAHTVKGL